MNEEDRKHLELCEEINKMSQEELIKMIYEALTGTEEKTSESAL